MKKVAVTPAQRRAKDKYEKKTYKPMQIKPLIAEAERIRMHIEERGESLTRFLIRAAETQIGIDKDRIESNADKNSAGSQVEK